MLAASLCLGLV